MAAKKTIKGKKAQGLKGGSRKEIPQFFRLNIEVGDLESAASFYARLLGVEGRRQAGSRCYFDCGPVTLQVVDVSSSRPPQPLPKALYFTVRDLEAVYDRAKSLRSLATGEVHDAQGGGIVVRPWGERSFYVDDPWKNPLCFVEEGTVYTG